MISLSDLRQYVSRGDDRPPANNEIEITERVTEPTSDSEPFLSRNNMGLGVLDERERYQQLQGYFDGLYGHAALARTIEDIAIKQAQQGLLANADAEPPDDFRDHDRFDSVREWRAAKRRELWQAADEQQQLDAIREHAGLTRDWMPSHWRMNIARTEFSRSQDGRLLGDSVGRTREIKADVPEEMQGQLGRRANR